jgi:hypothetical protein
LLGSIVLGALAWIMTGSWLARRMAGASTPGQLGATRAVVCAILLMSSLWEDISSTALLPHDLIRPMGLFTFVRRVPGFDHFLYSADALAAFNIITSMLLLLGVLGLFTRLVVPLAAVCYFVQAGLIRQYAWFYHTGLIPLFVLIVLALTPCGDGFSLDRLRRTWKNKPVAPLDLSARLYGWAVYACWVPVGMAYLWAGMSKIAWSGWDWWRPDNLRGIVVQDTLQPMQFDMGVGVHLVSAPDWIFAMMGICAILNELSGVLLISVPRAGRVGRYVRWIVPMTLAGMHVGIWVMQNILFYDLILIQIIFLDWTAIRRWIGRRLNARAGALRILTPDAISDRARHVLRGLDLFERLEWSEPSSIGRNESPVLRVARQDREYEGDAALRQIARVLPALWAILPALYARTLARKAHRALASRAAMHVRQTLLRPSPQALTKLSLCGFMALWTTAWRNRVEYYPLTSVQMYTMPDRPPGFVKYVKVVAHHADGTTDRAYPERAIGALADSRYRHVLDLALSKSPRDNAIADKVLHTCGKILNQQNASAPGRRITSLEVQRIEWDFAATPDDPNHGQVTSRYIVQIP